LLIITALGAASVVGIQASAINMRDVADKTYKEKNLYDIQIKSTMGFDEHDASALAGDAAVYSVMPTTIYDVFISIDGRNRPARTYALPEGINEVDIVEGRLPLSPRECLAERRIMNHANLKIGDTVRLGLDDMDAYFDVLAYDSFTVVGVVSSPLYISFERGNTTLGDGSLQYYMYLHPGAYTLDVYTDVYLLMAGSQDMYNLSDDYYDAAEVWIKQTEQVGEARVAARINELDDAQREIDDGWAEYFDGVDELEEKLTDGRRELEDARIKLEDALAELEDGQRKLDESVADGFDEIERQTRELRSGQNELNARRVELEDGQAQIDDAREQLEQALAGLSAMAPRGLSPELDAQYEMIYAALHQLDVRQAEIDEGRAAIVAAQFRLDDGARLLGEARITLEDERVKAQREINAGWIEYCEGLYEYNKGVMTLNDEEADALVKLEDARIELLDAQEKLDDAPVPEWFYFARKDGLLFDSYYQDTNRLQSVGYVFPMVFFLVAVMVSLTSMSRMVAEHRTQIGVYKALGYRPAASMMKYLVYAFSASFFGGLAGVILGSQLFPIIIEEAYSHLYEMPPVETPIPVAAAAVAVISAVLSVVLVTLWTCLSSLKGAPALLMRPKPPSKGKRVWLERIPLIWNRIGFLSKVTARNILRYKKRFIMTLVGVAGCSALLITAFGLRDSLGGVGALQYEVVISYDARAYLKNITTEKQRAELVALLPENHLFIREEALTATGEKEGLPAAVIIPDSPERLTDYLSLSAPDTGRRLSMAADSVIITEKLARVMEVGVGDKFTMTTGEGRKYTAVVAGIAENYIHHYIYMAPGVYTETFGEAVYPNSVLIFYDDGREFAAPLLENSDVRAIIHNDDLMSQVDDSTDALGIVTIVLIVLACALAFVVLFNLTNINISERIRELATIKVLGFYNNELALYIYRENAVVTLLGIVLGLLGGVALHGFVITTVEVDILKFPKLIHPQSYVFAILLSIAFAVFVNLVMSFKLARINMVESLKSGE